MNVSAANPVLDEIRQLYDEKRTGVFALTSGTGEHVDVFFREGMIEAASSNLKDHRLGDYLLKSGRVQADVFDGAQTEANRRKILFGEAVVRKEIADRAEVGAAVRRQAIDLLGHVFKNDFAVDSFTNSLRAYYVPARISFPHVLLELCRRNAAPFDPVSTQRIALSDGIDFTAFPWDPQELFLLNELMYPNTFQGLLKATGMEEGQLRKMLGVLEMLGVTGNPDSFEMSVPAGIQDLAIVGAGAVARTSEFPFEHLIPVVTNAALDEKLEVARNKFSFISEQFRNLKVLISEANSRSPLKVLTISSPDPGDGKSLIAVNLGFSFAMDPGRRVIVVDCDLRRPSLAKYLGVSSEPGLLQYVGGGRLSPYCYVRRIEKLYFLTTGGTASSPIEILSMQKMGQLIEYLRRDFDTIILDAPPYAPIADARIVTGLSDGLIMVLRRGKTSYRSTDRAFSAVDRKKVLGVVFNDVQPMLFHTYHDFDYYGYGNKQGVYSGAKVQKNSRKKQLKS